MHFDEPIFPHDDKHSDFEQMREQTWYLKGVLLSDPEYRMNPKFDPKLIDPWAYGTPAFWRGVLETPRAGAIRMDRAGGNEDFHPTVVMRGSYPFLATFLAFLEEHLGAHAQGINSSGMLIGKFDDDGKLAYRAGGGMIWVRGPKAQSIVRLLYTGQTVGRATPGQTADAIFAWCSRKR